MKWLIFLTAIAAAGCRQSPAAVADSAVDAVVADELVAVDAVAADVAAQSEHVRAALAERPPEILRFVVHLHGPFSKDACDGNGLPDGKTPNAACVADLRAGLCASGLSVVFLTDHPSHMKDFPFQDLLYYDAAAGDKLITDAPDEPYANIVHCVATPLLPAHDVQLLVGFEGDHTMPVGLHHHLSDKALYNVALSDSVPLADVQTVTAEVHARGGLMVLAHAEQGLISAQRVHDAIDVVELYNIHANVMLSYIADPARLFEMDPWLAPPAEAAHPDLAIVPILTTPQEQPIALWHQVLQTQKVGTALGSDAHENVQFPQLCQGGLTNDLCEQKKATAPYAYKAFSKAGQVTLSDGVRYDNYTRMLRWYSSRARLPISQMMNFARVQKALQEGRTHHVWNVFGEPDRVDLITVAQGEWGWKAADIGESVKATPDMLLAMAWPHVLAEPWSPFATADADKAPREVRLWRVTPEGASVIATWDGQKTTGGLVQDGEVAWLPMPGPGRYHLEVRIQPTHLAAPLKAASAFAQNWYRWVLTDVIEVTGP